MNWCHRRDTSYYNNSPVRSTISELLPLVELVFKGTRFLSECLETGATGAYRSNRGRRGTVPLPKRLYQELLRKTPVDLHNYL